MSAARKSRPAVHDIAQTLRTEMEWLSVMIDLRIRRHFRHGESAPAEAKFPPPPTLPRNSRYVTLVTGCVEKDDEPEAVRLLFALALAPHVAPHLLDVFFLKNEKTERGFTEFGGVKGIHHAGFVPTGETALFLLCGDDVAARLATLPLLEPTHPMYVKGPLRLATPQPDEPSWSGALGFSPSYLRHLTTGEEPRPELGVAFPARPVTTTLTWDDLVLDPKALAEVGEIKIWALHEDELLHQWGLGRHVKPGYRALFHGPSGTGKTLTATLLGNELQREVYRVDLSQVVSKYIGETEKNLAAVFTEAERRKWILFFDEADALFGKRTQTSSSHDRYANQEVAFLLQRVEDHPGTVILATNLKSNLDDAFARRFQSVIYFAPPTAAQRLQLWRNSFGSKVKFESDVDLSLVARQHELTGGQIINVVRYACIVAVQNGGKIAQRSIEDGCRRELRNLGRTA